MSAQPVGQHPNTLASLVGSGDRIAVLTLPFLLVGLVLNALYPELFTLGGARRILTVVSVLLLLPGVIIWIWSAVLILIKVPRGELITSGPYSLLRHPLYTAVALLVAPAVGFLCDSWYGVVVGAALYVGSRLFSPLEEKELAGRFGPAWDNYCKTVKLPWL